MIHYTDWDTQPDPVIDTRASSGTCFPRNFPEISLHRNGRLNGFGKYFSADGETKYEGGFKSDVFHGKGILFTANGNVYEGEFKDGSRDGVGKLIKPNGDAYRGRWVEDVLISGSLTYADGRLYEGDFLHEKPHGKVSFQFEFSFFCDKHSILLISVPNFKNQNSVAESSSKN